MATIEAAGVAICPEGVRKREERRGVLGDGDGQRGDLAAVLHGNGRNGVRDVFADRRDMHDSVAGHERVGRGIGVQGRLWRGEDRVDGDVRVGRGDLEAFGSRPKEKGLKLIAWYCCYAI
ncbi:hypothetical protein CRYUN_Cryun10bG0172500 [Craigia yunnanensis]